MKKIMYSKKKEEKPIIPFSDLLIPDQKERKTTSRTSKKVSSPSKYLCVPPMIEKFEKNEGDRMKVEARVLYETQEKTKQDFTNR
jgi:hypothetical protein